HFLLVDSSTPNDLIYRGHQVFEIVAWILVLDDVSELLAVAGTATRIRIEHDVSFRRHPLEFVLEDVAVGRMRSAVNIENQRILLRRIVSRLFLDPALNAFDIKAFVPDFLRLGEIELAKEPVVRMRELARRVVR